MIGVDPIDSRASIIDCFTGKSIQSYVLSHRRGNAGSIEDSKNCVPCHIFEANGSESNPPTDWSLGYVLARLRPPVKSR